MRKIVLFVALLFATTLMANGINWAKDYKTGMQEAQKTNKPVLFVSSRHTCKYCVLLDETTFQDKRVIKALNKDFVSIISYSDEYDYMPGELYRPGTPAIWFLLPDGRPMYQPIMGALDADNFLEAIAVVKSSYDKYMAEQKSKSQSKGK